MVPEDIKATRKIRIYPNKTQKKFFTKCFGATRYVFNTLVDFCKTKVAAKNKQLLTKSINGCAYINKKKTQCCKTIHDDSKYFCKLHHKSIIDYGYKLNFISLRNNVLVNNSNLSDDKQWLKDVPYDTRQLIIKDFVTAKKSISTNIKQGNIKFGNIQYKSRKHPTQIFHINKKALTAKLELFKRKKLGKLRTRNKQVKWLKNNLKSIDHDCKIIKYADGSYYVLLLVDSKKEIIKPLCKIAALDPGVKTFQTFYSADGVAGKLGHNFSNKIKQLTEKISLLNSLKSKYRSRTKRNISHRQTLLRTKIKNLVDNLHWKTAHFLCTNFSTIIIPSFESKKMSKKGGRNINRETVKKLLSLSHYKFRCRLEQKAKQYGSKIITCSEEYTSKTCGICGNIKDNLGGSREYKCKECGYKIDRDYNGARNILISVCTKLN